MLTRLVSIAESLPRTTQSERCSDHVGIRLAARER